MRITLSPNARTPAGRAGMARTKVASYELWACEIASKRTEDNYGRGGHSTEPVESPR